MLYFLNDYSIKNTSGNVMLTNYSLLFENDGSGNVALVVNNSEISYNNATKNVVLTNDFIDVYYNNNSKNVTLDNVVSVTENENGNISITI